MDRPLFLIIDPICYLIYHKFKPNVGKYPLHGASGYDKSAKRVENHPISNCRYYPILYDNDYDIHFASFWMFEILLHSVFYSNVISLTFWYSTKKKTLLKNNSRFLSGVPLPPFFSKKKRQTLRHNFRHFTGWLGKPRHLSWRKPRCQQCNWESWDNINCWKS